MESMGAHKAGLAKIIPPEGWCPRKGGYDDIDLMIPAPISQVVTGRQGLYQQYNVQQKAMHVKEFQRMAQSSKYKTPNHFDYEDLERKYWKNITYNSPIYGADVSGSLYDDGVEEFNIQHLNTILDMVKENYEIQIEGVNTAYLYFGMWKTTFAWHTEDMDLYSINYLHFGAPKSWYVVPPEHGRRLERLAAGFFHGSHQLCGAFLRHKMTIISPMILKKFSIPCSKITQEPGEFMITFPFGYHSGFNHGFNCAESTNFALTRWIEYGKRSSQCTCRNDCVKICMDVFVRKFQSERYELWKAGKDIGCHPEEPSKMYAAPPPNKLELAMSVKKEKKKTKIVQQKIKRHPVSDMGNKKKKRKLTKYTYVSSDDESEKLGENELVSGKKKRKRKYKEALSEENNSKFESKFFSDTDGSETQLLDLKSDDADNPPELKPFWDPETEKVRLLDQDDSSKAETVILADEPEIIQEVKNNFYQSEAEIIDKFPLLKNAINHGTLSLMLVDENTNLKQGKHFDMSQVESQTKITKDNPKFFQGESSSIFAQNWRCEQINNGLKIKFVSPKSNQQNVIPPMTEFPKISSVGECSVSYASEETIIDNSIPPEIHSTALVPTKSVIKESPPSNFPNESNSKVKRAANSKGNWAHPLVGLWHHEKYNHEAVCRYNQRLASISPHCAICVIFSPMLDNNSFPVEPTNVPSFSHVKMPAFCYGNECILDTNPLLNSDGTAPLLICSICKVCVHAPCYGVSVLPMSQWYCNKCSARAIEAQCCLCVLRGGALKPTTDGRWAHVICSILITESTFESTVSKEPINVSKISHNRMRLKCKYCIKAHAHKDQRGVCVQCQSGKCYLPFHVTCGYMAGVIFEASDWPEPVNMICTKHASARRKPVVRQFTNVSVGESVIAKHKNRRYYWANVKQKYIQEYYSILFEDNSHSKNTLPEDIVSRDVAMFGPPEINEKVQVKWTDGKIYNGIFKGSQSVEMFVVEFDDETVQHQERRQIFAADEELPKEVQSKMSHSSEGRSLNISASEANGKRLRLINQKYYSV